MLIIFSEYILLKAKEKTDKAIVDFIYDTISAGYDVILVKKVGEMIPDIEQRFNQLRDKWLQETMFLSSSTAIANNENLKR